MALAASSSGSESAAAAAVGAEGPVLSLMSKRLRALRKKYNRIIQMEASLVQGKTLNKEQEEVLRSKPGVVALIDEYEKLRPPLASAVQEELSRAASCSSSGNPKPKPNTEAAEESSSSFADSAVEDLLALLYFGCLFDVKPQSEFTSMMLTRTHERGCCLTYDYVTDDATELLGEKDLDMISGLGGLVTSRPLYSGISHMSALHGCLQHAKLWLEGAHQPVVSGSSVTYAALREKLNKIMSSDYYTTTPEMKAPVDVAAAVGKYNAAFQGQVSESTDEPTPDAPSDAVPIHHHQQEDEQEYSQAADISPEQSGPTDELQKDEVDELDPIAGDINALQYEQQIPEADVEEHTQRDFEQGDHQYVHRRSYQSQRGSRGGRGIGGLRGYSNARGRNGRGGGGGYQNGRSQYYDPGYQPRNYYNNTRGRGGRSGGSAMYNHQGGLSHDPSNAKLGPSAQ